MVKFSKLSDAGAIKLFTDDKRIGQIVFQRKEIVPAREFMLNIRQAFSGCEAVLSTIEGLFISVEQRNLPVDISEVMKKARTIPDENPLNTITAIQDTAPYVFDASGNFIFDGKVIFINTRNTASAYHAINRILEQVVKHAS